MTVTHVVKVFRNEALYTTMCFDDYQDAIEAEETFKQAGNTVVVISEESDDVSFEDGDDDAVS